MRTNKSVDQIFDALGVLGESTIPVGVADLARAMGLPTSTAHRLLATLEATGFAERDMTGVKYELGVPAHQLVHALFRQYRIQSVGEAALRRLVRVTGETVTLDVRVGWYVVRMSGLEGSREEHAATRIGQTQLLGDSIAGVAILGCMDEDELDRYRRWCAAGSCASAAWEAQVRASREVGYAYSALAGGAGAELALPIRTPDRAVAALSIEGAGSALLPRVSPSHLERCAEIVDSLERLVAEDPALARDPFEHVDPDEIRLAVSPVTDSRRTA